MLSLPASRFRGEATNGYAAVMSDLELRYEHLQSTPRDTPARRERRRRLTEHIADIWAEQELRNQQLRAAPTRFPGR